MSIENQPEDVSDLLALMEDPGIVTTMRNAVAKEQSLREQRNGTTPRILQAVGTLSEIFGIEEARTMITERRATQDALYEQALRDEHRAAIARGDHTWDFPEASLFTN